MANAVVIVLGILTSLMPAWRASQYRPVEAIAKT
jgi:ABC-type lipoprotein release transport system permease subunit